MNELECILHIAKIITCTAHDRHIIYIEGRSNSWYSHPPPNGYHPSMVISIITSSPLHYSTSFWAHMYILVCPKYTLNLRPNEQELKEKWLNYSTTFSN